jgi:hypothetical protein
MSQPDIIYADRILNLSVTGSVVRLELGVSQMPDNSGQPAKVTPTQTLIIPLEGFVNSFGLMEQMMKKLAENGVVTARKPDEEPAATKPALSSK